MSYQNIKFRHETTVGGNMQYRLRVFTYNDLATAIFESNSFLDPTGFSSTYGDGATFPIVMAIGDVVIVEYDPGILIDGTTADPPPLWYDKIYIEWGVSRDNGATWIGWPYQNYALLKTDAEITYDPTILFDWEPNRKELPEYFPSQQPSLYELGQSIPSLDINKDTQGTLHFKNSYTLFTDQEIADFQQFYFDRYGSAFSFFLPSWQSDLILSDDSGFGSTIITIEPTYFDLDEGRWLFFYCNCACQDHSGASGGVDNYYFVREIESIDGNTITLTESLPCALYTGFGISIIHRVFFKSEAIELNHATNSIVNVELEFTEAVN